MKEKSVKLLKTNKLFYGQWPYRVEVQCTGVALLARYTLDEAVAIAERRNQSKYSLKINISLLKTIGKALAPVLRKNYKIRAEGPRIHFYLEKEDDVDFIVKHLKPYVSKIHKPASSTELTTLEDKINTVLCDSFPHGEFRYKITLQYKTPSSVKETFLKWTEQFPGAVRFTPLTKDWLVGGRKYVYSPYFYIKDESFLAMTGLFLGSNIKKTEFYIKRDDK